MTTRRRTLLVLAGSTFAGLAGCTGDFDPSDGTPDGTPEEPSDESSDETSGEISAQVDLSTKSYVVSAAPAEKVTYVLDLDEPEPVSEFPEPLADALREARDGGFETDEPGDELLAAIDEVRDPGSNHRLSELSVRIDGTEYVAALQLPELEVRLTDEELDEYDADRLASRDDEFEHEEVEYLVERIGWNGTANTARTPYRMSLVPGEIEEFLDSYDYVEDYAGVSPIAVERRNWEPPYSIELREFTAEDRWGREILDVQTLGDGLQELLEDVVESAAGVRSPPFVTDDVPETYFETLETDSEDADRPFVRVAGTVYDVRVSEGTHETMPITTAVEPASPTEDGLARFTLRVEVTDDEPGVEVATGESVELHGNVGLPSALWIAHGSEYHLLDSERYEVDVTGEDGGGSWSLAVDDPEPGETAVSEELSVGDELTATYVVPATVPAGSYTLPGNFAALWQEDPDDVNRADGIYPFQIELTLEEP